MGIYCSGLSSTNKMNCSPLFLLQSIAWLFPIIVSKIEIFFCITLLQNSSIYPKFTSWKSHFWQNSHFQILIFDKIHIFKVWFFSKFTILESQLLPQKFEFLDIFGSVQNTVWCSNLWQLNCRMELMLYIDDGRAQVKALPSVLFLCTCPLTVTSFPLGYTHIWTLNPKEWGLRWLVSMPSVNWLELLISSQTIFNFSSLLLIRRASFFGVSGRFFYCAKV